MARTFGARIAKIARKEAKESHGTACGPNKAGTRGYFRSCDGNNGQPEFWCADFARWVWWKAGAVNTAPGTHILNHLAASFANYGPVRHSTDRRIRDRRGKWPVKAYSGFRGLPVAWAKITNFTIVMHVHSVDRSPDTLSLPRGTVKI